MILLENIYGIAGDWVKFCKDKYPLEIELDFFMKSEKSG